MTSRPPLEKVDFMVFKGMVDISIGKSMLFSFTSKKITAISLTPYE